MPTVEDLGKLMKQKFPGPYDQIPDAEVGRLVRQKYPDAYTNFADVAEAPTTPPSGPPSTRPEDVPSALQGTSSPIAALGGFLRMLGLQGFEDTAQYPTPSFTHAPTAEERAAGQAQAKGLGEPTSLENVGVGTVRAGLAGAAGIAGAPGDLLNVPGSVSALLGGPDFRLPIGSEVVARQFGIKPESMSLLERGIQAISGAVSPGKFLQAAEYAGVLPNLAKKLYKFMSAGSIRGDVFMGGGTFAGQETAHALFPESSVAPIIGGAAGGLTVSGVHGLLDSSLRRFGKPHVLRQKGEAAETAAVAAKQTSEGELQAAEQGVLDTREALAAQKRRGEVATDIRKSELARVQQASAENVATSETALAKGMAPLGEQLRQGVLKERTVAGTPRAIPQIAPGTEETGAKVLQNVADLDVRIQASAAKEGEALLDSLGPRLTEESVLAKSRDFYHGKWFTQTRNNLGSLFDATENVTGAAPVLDLSNLKARAATFAEEAATTGQPSARGTGALSHIGIERADLEQLLLPGEEAGKLYGKTLTSDQRAMAQKFLTDPNYFQGEGKEALVPFFIGRRIESALSRIAYENAPPIGSITQGKARAMLQPLQEDMHAFYVGDYATQHSDEIAKAMQTLGMEGAATIEGALPRVRAMYRTFIQQQNDPIIQRILSSNERTQRQFLAPFRASGGDHRILIDAKQVASPEVWDMLGAYTLAEGNRLASISGQFDVTAMQKWLIDMRKSGKLDILFTPEKVAQIERSVTKMSADEIAHLPAFRGALRQMPTENVVPWVFEPGEMTRTQNFKTIVSEDVFDGSVKAYAADMLKDLADPNLSPMQLYNRYAKLIDRPRIGGGVGHGGGYGPSQLDIMLTEYPGVSDDITRTFQDMSPRAAALKQTRQEAAQNISEARRQLAETTAGEVKKLEPLVEDVAFAEGTQRRIRGEQKTLVDEANEYVQEIRKQAKVPEGQSVYSYYRMGQLHIRTAENAGMLLGTAALLQGIISRDPLYVLGGLAGIAGTVVHRYGIPLADTLTGSRLIRQGLDATYAPSVVGRTLQALGASTEEKPTTEPQGAPQPQRQLP